MREYNLVKYAIATTAFMLSFLSLHGCEGDSGKSRPASVDSDFPSQDSSEDVADSDFQATPIPTTCVESELNRTSVGCEFYAVDLINSRLFLAVGEVIDGQMIEEPTPSFAVGVANVHESNNATVTVHRRNAGSWDEYATVTVSPLGSEIVSLEEFEAKDHSDFYTGIMGEGAYRITSDIPVAAYQFSPLDGEFSFTSDASMLVPSSFWGSQYAISGWRTYALEFPAQAVVIAKHDGTEVTVSLSYEPYPTPPNYDDIDNEFTVTLNEGQILYVNSHWGTMLGHGQTITGTVISSDEDHPIGVFTSHDCAVVPASSAPCDHLEEQLLPTTALGRGIIAARVPSRKEIDGRTDKVLWQFVAGFDNTKVSFEAPTDLRAFHELGEEFDWSDVVLRKQGDYVQLWVDGSANAPGDFLVTATKPISAVQYMSSAAYVEHQNTLGDPLMLYVPPLEQFLSKYVVYVPPTWENDFLVITKKIGAEVLVNSKAVPDSEFTQVGQTEFSVARHPVTEDGTYIVESTNKNDPIGVLVVGYDNYDSYGYPGGMGIKSFSPN